MAISSTVMVSTTITGVLVVSGRMMPAIAWVSRTRIAPSRIVSEARARFVVRPLSAEVKDFAVAKLVVVAKLPAVPRQAVGRKGSVAEKPVAAPLQSGRSLPPIGVVIARLAELRTAAPLVCKAITDSPAWGTPDSAEAEVASAVAAEAASMVAVVDTLVAGVADRGDRRKP
jgi:hypothetical protein